MRFYVQPMTVSDAEAIASWKYEGEYSSYSMDSDPEDLEEFLDPTEASGEMRYTIKDDVGGIVGFYTYSKRNNSLEIGLGLHPLLTGKGIGLDFVKEGVHFAQEHFHAEHICLFVAAFNQRAVKVYLSAGFRILNRSMRKTNGSEFEFLEMQHYQQP